MMRINLLSDRNDKIGSNFFNLIMNGLKFNFSVVLNIFL